MRSHRPSGVPPTRLVRLALLVSLAAACTKVSVTGVVVQEIAVLPASVTVLRDESVQLVAQVRDAEGRLLEPANVTWTSDRPSVVSVSADGLVSAVGVGSAIVRASLGGAEGVAYVTAMSRTLLRVEPASVTLRGAVGFGSPEAVQVDIRDEGQEVVDLEASIAYPAGSSAGWLQARLHDAESPTKLDVSAESSGMPAGVYGARVLISGRDMRDAPAEISVTMTLAGIEVRETDGRTLVAGSSGSDDITVKLMLRPERDVVLHARSRDGAVAVVSPESVRFTPESWDVAQTLRVTAGSGGSNWWGYNTTEISITVDGASSDPMYHPVGETTVTATVFRSPFR
jgi:hypothetical protein